MILPTLSRRRLRRLKRLALEGTGTDSASPEDLAGWENEGGTMSQKKQAEQALPTLLERGKESAADLALWTKARAQRARLALELRRLESRIDSEIGGLGHDVFPLLKEGSLRIDLPAIVNQRIRAISEMQDELGRKKVQSNELRTAKERDEAKRESMMNTDANAAEGASAVQAAEDEAATAAGQPAEQGGQG